MTGEEQRAALQRSIWGIANDVRGSVDGWDFKQYVLGTLFYRFISENFAAYIGRMRRASTMLNYPTMSSPMTSRMTPSRPRVILSIPASCSPMSRKTPTLMTA
ncbi:MAG: type I restriction-modification system subunit M N-terminal domain-containing protein [Nitratireductor sp.]